MWIEGRRVAVLPLVGASALLAGCAAGNPYRAEPLAPEIEDRETTNPTNEIRARVESGLLIVDLSRTSHQRWKERPLFRERRTSYDPLSDAQEFLFFPILFAGYAALSPMIVPLDSLGTFTSYVEGYPDPRPWGLALTLGVGLVPGWTTHFFDTDIEAGENSGFVRGSWMPEEKWVTRPIPGAKVEVLAPDGSAVAQITTDEAGHGALFLRNHRDLLLPLFAAGPIRLRVVHGGAGAEVPIHPGDLR